MLLWSNMHQEVAFLVGLHKQREPRHHQSHHHADSKAASPFKRSSNTLLALHTTSGWSDHRHTHAQTQDAAFTSHLRVCFSVFRPTKSWTIHNKKISRSCHSWAQPCLVLPYLHLIFTLLQGRVVTAVTFQWHTIRQKCDVNVWTEVALQNISKSGALDLIGHGIFIQTVIKNKKYKFHLGDFTCSGS